MTCGVVVSQDNRDRDCHTTTSRAMAKRKRKPTRAFDVEAVCFNNSCPSCGRTGESIELPEKPRRVTVRNARIGLCVCTVADFEDDEGQTVPCDCAGKIVEITPGHAKKFWVRFSGLPGVWGFGDGDLVLPPDTVSGPRVATPTYDLFHGTIRDNLDDISLVGIVPDIGPFVQWAYTDEIEAYRDYYGEPLDDYAVAFFATRDNLHAALTAMQHHIASATGDPWTQITIEDIRDHGLLLAVDSADGFLTYDGNDDTIRELDGEDEPERFNVPFREWYDDSGIVQHGHDGHIGIEDGDVFSKEPVIPDAALFGDELVAFVRRHAPDFLPGQ